MIVSNHQAFRFKTESGLIRGNVFLESHFFTVNSHTSPSIIFFPCLIFKPPYYYYSFAYPHASLLLFFPLSILTQVVNFLSDMPDNTDNLYAVS